MAFDGIVTRAVVEELKSQLLGGRINKIHQHERDELLIQIYNKGINHRLMISANSSNSRIYLTDQAKRNPETPPSFCMLLRKHLTNGTVLNIEQYDMDRIIFIDISALDELGLPIENRLVIEIMGKHSNIILVNKESGKIIDAIKRVSESISRVRQILPGMTYEYPPAQGKKNPLNTSREEFLNLLEGDKKGILLYKFFYFNYTGLSPLLSRELCFRTGLDIDRPLGSLNDKEKNELYSSFETLMTDVKENRYKPLCIYNPQNEVLAFYCLDLVQFGNHNKEYLPSISQVLDKAFRKRDLDDRLNQKSQSMRKIIQARLDRSMNKLARQKEELLQSQDREKYKVYADLISANIHLIPKGADRVELENFYDENLEKIEVPLDHKISAVANAQRYYKRYSKLKTAENLLKEQIPETQKEILYLENVLVSIDNASQLEELDEIREELVKEGYLKEKSRGKKSNKGKVDRLSQPHNFISSDGFKIYVGKNNRQNERLTLKTAHKDDIWLHAQNIPGSHVIIVRNNQEIPDTTLEEAAILAAYFSKAKNSSKVPVDYTERRNVKKQANSKPGMVIYNNFKTITVSPDKEIISKLKS
ncbi:MAG: Rqc2 family fibronectin-binding protein [Tissierellaceae bacterium]|jgi:predicted ribosome quality control (RQC) complex YloA/Tae2 family protein|nr:fibronectin/fibrinogen-binding protein [Tissierellia bacterium]